MTGINDNLVTRRKQTISFNVAGVFIEAIFATLVGRESHGW